MDLTLAPKLLAAALVGGAVVTLPRPSAPADATILKLEWIEANKEKRSEAITVRAAFYEKTTFRQGSRTVEATPEVTTNGDITIDLKIVDESKDRPEGLTTKVSAKPGETYVLMGTVKKEGKSAKERLLFLTATPL